MRTSIVGAAFLLAGAGAASVAALDTTATTSPSTVRTPCSTSPTRHRVVQHPVHRLRQPGITYLGGGSGVGAGGHGPRHPAGRARCPARSRTASTARSRPSATATGGAATASNGPEGLLVGIDGVAIAANQTNSCSSTSANGFGITAAFPVTAGRHRHRRRAGDLHLGCDGLATTTRSANSFDALSVLYFGFTHDGTYNCSSPIRKSLVAQLEEPLHVATAPRATPPARPV